MNRVIAAFLTGPSVPGCTGLSREQLAFQRKFQTFLAEIYPRSLSTAYVVFSFR